MQLGLSVMVGFMFEFESSFALQFASVYCALILMHILGLSIVLHLVNNTSSNLVSGIPNNAAILSGTTKIYIIIVYSYFLFVLCMFLTMECWTCVCF